MPILHEVDVLGHGVLEGRPDLALHLLVGDLQGLAQGVHAEVGKVVDLNKNMLTSSQFKRDFQQS